MTMIFKESFYRSFLWLLVTVVFHGSILVESAIPIHLPHITDVDSVIFNCSVEEAAHYSLHPTLTSETVKKIVEIERFSGIVRLKSEIDCNVLQLAGLNPFYLYVEYSSRTTQNNGNLLKVAKYNTFHTLLPLAVYIHGGACRPQHGKRKDSHYEETHTSRSAAQVSRIRVEFPDGSCWTQGENIVNLYHFFPSSFVLLCQPECSLQNGTTMLIDCSNGNLKARGKGNCLYDTTSVEIKAQLTISQHCLDQRHKTFARLREEILPVEIQIQNAASRVGETSRILKRSRRQTSGTNRSPMFSTFLHYHSVPENEDAGYIVATITASDPDSGERGRLTYSLVAERDGRSQNMFSIDQNTGTISTTRVLDREVIANHYFRILATDHGSPPREANAQVEIQVEDRNDHRPEFEMPQYYVQMDENSGAVQVIEVHAIDEDSGSNGAVEYTILNPESPNNVFFISTRTGSISTTRSLDREETSSYILVIQAKDSGTIPSSLNSTAEVIVTVLDQNDNTPQFESKSYDVSVREDVDPYSNRIILLSVVAQDADEGRNADIRYNMVGGNSQGKFSIDPISGDIILTSALDYESTPVYRLNVRAQDGGTPIRSQMTSVVVAVEDVNDNVPRFQTTLYQRAVREDVRPGYSVTLVQAYDADHGSNAEVRYSFQNPPDSLPFEIDPESGQITNTVELDREDTAQWDFVVVAMDMGIPPLSSTVQISIVISDVNDNPPYFEKSEYQTVVDEDVHAGTTVITLKAIDPDEGNSISYQIDLGNKRNRFSILSMNNEGILSVAFPLDYRQESQFALTVAASDNQYSSSCTVIINVTDANTYRPIFDQSPYSEIILENVEIGTIVAQVHAIDNDFGENARITYSMGDPQSSPEFEIDADTGIIRTLQLLDREKRPSYTLYVSATDNGEEPLFDTTEVEFYLTDVNDNAPVFSEQSYSVSILENAAIHASVLQISATDADYGINSQITYRFASGRDGDGAFVIDDSAGIIRVAKNLDRESVAEYHLVAFAVDGGEDPNQTPVDILVQLQDQNDNAPVFPSSEIHAEIEENQSDGEYVITIQAVDPDEGLNAHIIYNLQDGDTNSFAIDSRSGVITTSIPLDYEEKSEYRVKVRATSSPFFKDATVVIHILDVNDNWPILENFDVIFNNYQGHFEDGVIGRVPAYDPDVNDVLEYSILNGNQNSHLLVNSSTGQIVINPTLTISDLNQRISFVVEVSDGEHPVRATCTFHLTIVDDDMLQNSITVQLADVRIETFLSEKLRDFIDTLSSIIPTNKNFIYLFSVRDVLEDSGPGVMNVTFAAKFSDDRFFSSQYLQERVYLNRSHLSSRIASTILPFGDNICLWEVCSDYYDCIDTFSFWLPGAFISTDKVIFRPIHPGSIHKCDCPLGFSGNYCATEVNFCYSNPCKNNAECVQTESGYTCICEDRFAGINCELDLEESHCPAPESFCKNGGVCRSYLDGGFHCNCSREQDGPFCEIRTRNFGRGSYMTFWSLKQRIRLQISLSFATKQQNGLLFYNGRYNHQHDFIALEIVEGAVKFSFSTGIATTTVSASIPGGVSDGKWHTVTVKYVAKAVTIILDDCNPLVALQGRLGDYNCAGFAEQHGERRYLDLAGPFILGGLPSLLDSFPVSQTGFQGCIRDIYIDNVLLDLATSLADVQTQPGCVHLDDFCVSDPCHSEGSCVSEWDQYACICRKGSSGRNCHETIPDPVQLDGTGRITFDLPSTAISLPWENRIGFRTRGINGVLMSVILSPNFRVELKLSGGKLVYSTTSNPTALTLSTEVVNDGQWHNVLVTWKNDQIVMSLDYEKVKKSVQAEDVVEGRSIVSCTVGGRSDRTSVGFRGCLQAMEVGGVPLIPDEGDKHNIVAGCQASDLCNTVNCPPNSRCIDLWDAHECRCDQGYYGDACVSACSLGVCQHGATCKMSPSEPMGYVCQCSSQFFGSHCEHKIEPCPEGFWGYKLCGPCQCDEDRGFSAKCNTTTGECTCQENSYRPMDSDVCFPCNCYSVGSEVEACHEETGQCSCKRNVIGRQCDSCTDPYAEVTIRGCEVVYDSCPKRYTSDIWWPRTKFGRDVTVDCPDGSIGYASRHCDYDDNWGEPDLSNCTSERFNYLVAIDLTVLEPQTSAAIAFSMWEATTFTPSFFANDVYIAYKILIMLLRHESKQFGVNVTATIKSEYKKHIIESVSHLLNPVNRPHWMVIQETEGGTAELMALLEMFAATIARTSQSFNYTPQFSVISPNIILHHDIIVRENVSTVTIPRLEVTHNSDLHSEVTHVHIPGDAIQPKPDLLGPSTVSSNVAFSSFIQYNTIGNFLPNITDDSVRPSKGKVGQVINTPVISLTLYDELADPPFPSNLTTPIILEMISNDAVNRSGKQCIFWDFDYDNGTGGWSTEGCKLVGYNRTHVNCSCTHLTNFAAMMDRAPYEVRSDTTVPLHLLTYVGAGMGVLFLLVTFFILLCLPNLHCNLNSIHINFVFMLIAAELTFLVGVNTDIVFACTIVSICLHFLLLGAFSWMFIEAVHLYRMMTEVRNINMGPMTTYYIVCYGLPGIIVGLAVPLSNVDYGPQSNAKDQYFCWLSIFDMLIWSFAGPVLVIVALNVIVFIMAISISLRSGHKDPEFNSLKAGLRAAGILLPLLGITWVFGLLAVNQGMLLYQFLFAFCSFVLGVSIFIFYCILDSTVRLEILRCCFHVEGKKSQMDSASSRSALSYSKDTPSKFNIGISTGSMGSNRSSRQGGSSYHPNGVARKTASTTTNVTPSSNVDYVPPYYRPNGPTDLDDPRAALLSGNPANLLGGGDDDSESDSEASVQPVRDSMSLASSHSSDDEDGDFGDWKKIPRNESKMPDALRHVPVHSTPKDSERKKKQWPGEPVTNITDSDRKAGIGQRAEMRILDPKLPPDKGANSPTGSGGSGSVESQTKIQLVSQRPDILPLKGIMKKPRSDQGSYNGSGGSNLSLTRKPQIVSSQEKIAVVVNNHGDSDHETSV
ncbi:cadherin EGF LAG seven-pass G-type receptor 2-like isoform X4 [Apostichopus japonicus]|uniref:cadherin EGF LAG seven-pass G-type receptor 2-like isoform X4 n=1 Tax=Stichopus japonicus TaxID=307972 RepID=UPI003AB46D37